METYLRKYCRHISKLTIVVDVTETIKFIESNSFNTDEIVCAFRDTINIDKICDQINKDKFLRGHSADDKLNAIVTFFGCLHNLAKDLILEFEIYKCKTIETSSVVMRDNIMLIPHYRRYMKSLLGYEFDPDKAEWVMRSDNSRQLRCQLGAACILAALGQRQLDALNEGKRRLSGDDIGVSVAPLSLETGSPQQYDLEDEDEDEETNLDEETTLESSAVEANGVANKMDLRVIDSRRRRQHEESSTCRYCDRQIGCKEKMCRKCETSRNTWRNKEDRTNNGLVKGKSKSLVRINDDSTMSKLYGSRSTMTLGRCKVCSQRRIERSSSQVRLRSEEGPCDNSWRQHVGTMYSKGGDRSTMCEVCYRERIQHSFSNPLFRTATMSNERHQWVCGRCHLSNDAEMDRCRSCKGVRAQSLSTHVKTSVQLKCRRCAANNNIKYAACVECDRLKTHALTMDATTLGGKQWKCLKCTSINNFNKINCGFCGIENPVLRISGQHRPGEGSSLPRHWTCEGCSQRNSASRPHCAACSSSQPQPQPHHKSMKNQTSDLDDEVPNDSDACDDSSEEVFESCL